MDLAKKVEIFRSRFRGRQDVYGRARKVDDAKGQVRTAYSPVCNNLWAEFCHLERKTGVDCSDCEHQAWDPVTAENVADHICGSQMHNYYLMLEGGVVHFAAVDFDVKPGKEDKGYDFFEVQKVCAILKTQGIAYGIARSSSAGYHVYMFFEKPYSAAAIRAVMSKVFSWAGYDRYLKEGIKPAYPETFPKQDYVAKGFGNGLTPPMVEPMMMKGRKCWVDEEDKPIGQDLPEGDDFIKAQWNYLESMPWTDPAAFDRIIEEHRLKVDDLPTLKKQAEESLKRVELVGTGITRPHGQIEKVIFGCEAFLGLYQKIKENGHQPSHDEGHALWNLAINTADGRDWFRENVKSWGRNQREIKELEFSIRKNYRPNSCKTMKDQGICHKDGLCAQAAPRPKTADPADTDGALDDLTEQDQKQYNPYRFIFTEGAELLHELIKEADKLLEMPETEGEDVLVLKEQKLKDLVRRAQALDKKRVRDFKAHVDKLQKPLKIPKNRVAPLFKEASQERFERDQELLDEDSTVYEVGEFVYRKRIGGKFGYFQIVRGKNELLEKLLIDIDFVVTEERYFTEEGGVTRTVYKGYARSDDGERKFEIPAELWSSDAEFIRYFSILLGGKFRPIRKQVEHIRQAILGWCEKMRYTKKVSSLMTQGFYEGHFLMPSVTVDATGLRPTSPGLLEIAHKDVIGNLDWTILQEDVLLETLRHIKTDFLTAWPDDWTFTGLAHVFYPLMRHVMKWKTFPTLFYDGLTGIGKSELLRLFQKFYGSGFEQLINLTSSQKYLEEMGYEFKDVCLVADDFKDLSYQQRDSVMKQIQYGYDGSSSGKLKRDSTPRATRRNRATLIMSGEDFIRNQASVVARTLLVEVQKFDQGATSEAYLRCVQMSKNYCGVTPRFLHWLLTRDSELMQKDYEDIRMTLFRFANGRQNASRIANNVAANHITWKQFTSFMEDMAVISREEHEELNERHWTVSQTLFHRMVSRCEEEQESVNFKGILVSLIMSGAVRVEGLKQPVENPRAPVVGYLPEPTDPSIGHYYPDSVMNAVNEVLRPHGIVLPKRVVARQLIDSKIIKEVDAQRQNKLVRHGGGRVRVWVLDHTVLELTTAESKVEAVPAPADNVIELKPGVQAFRDGYGLF